MLRSKSGICGAAMASTNTGPHCVTGVMDDGPKAHKTNSMSQSALSQIHLRLSWLSQICSI